AADITVATGDLRSLIPNGGNNFLFASGNPINVAPSNADPAIKATLSRELVLLSANPQSAVSPRNWGNSEFGGQWFITFLNAAAQGLGEREHEDLPDITSQNFPRQTNNVEHVFPSAADVLFLQALHRPESRDIDLYQFNVTEAGSFRAETIAERLDQA